MIEGGIVQDGFTTRYFMFSEKIGVCDCSLPTITRA